MVRVQHAGRPRPARGLHGRHREPAGGAGQAGGQGDPERAHRLGGDERVGDAGGLRGGARQPVGDDLAPRPTVSQPGPFANGRTVVTEEADISITAGSKAMLEMPAGAQLADVVKALNALGATPQDLLAILQAMKSAGALHAEIEVI